MMTAESLRYCESIAVRGRNNLSRAARRLSEPEKLRLFHVTYATMRVLDDAVDVDFLSRSPDRRRLGRASVLDLIARWQEQVEQAAAGRFVPMESSFEPRVFSPLNEYLAGSEIGLEPWRLLARSVRHDALEQRLETWSEFLTYCEGACVAPGSVFIYILACDVVGRARTRVTLPAPVAAYARDMAIFCYVVHILRDLPADARRNQQLLTIPNELLRAAHLSLEDFVTAVREGDGVALRLVTGRLIAEAEAHSDRAKGWLAELGPCMGSEEQAILRYLYRLYEQVFREVRARS